MRRLNDRAYEILAAEVKRLAPGTLESVRRDIVLRRLKKFQFQEGPPLTYAELKAEVEDIFPDFDERVLQTAARANQRVGKLGLVRNVLLSSAIAAGGLWVINLPYPMIRWPVSRTAPILLLPSFLSMDHHYRQAIALVEQADQLVNQATSAQDIALGAEKVQAAQHHLDQLPVWFLGYYPRAYCTWVSCTWRFTYDEFQTARQAIGRMEAKVFQEHNAQQALEQGTAAVETAKQQYQAATTTQDKVTAATAWQQGVDQLNEIPPATLAGRQAQTKLEAYRRDLTQVAGVVSGGTRAATLIEAAKQFAWTASVEAQNAPHPPETWARIGELWQQAIDRLNQVPVEDAGYDEAQRMLAEYQNKYGVVQEKQVQEERSQAALAAAQQKNIRLGGQIQSLSTAEYASALQSILDDLRQVMPGTTVYEPAQQLRQAVESRLREVAANPG